MMTQWITHLLFEESGTQSLTSPRDCECRACAWQIFFVVFLKVFIGIDCIRFYLVELQMVSVKTFEMTRNAIECYPWFSKNLQHIVGTKFELCVLYQRLVFAFSRQIRICCKCRTTIKVLSYFFIGILLNALQLPHLARKDNVVVDKFDKIWL